MFAFLDGVESRRGGGISRNGNPIGKAWHCTQAGSGDVFPTGTHVNAPSLVSCLPARLIFEHASFDAYLPSPSLASAREARNIRLRFHRPQPRTFSNGKSKYPYLLTSLDFLALLGEGKEKKRNACLCALDRSTALVELFHPCVSPIRRGYEQIPRRAIPRLQCKLRPIRV